MGSSISHLKEAPMTPATGWVRSRSLSFGHIFSWCIWEFWGLASVLFSCVHSIFKRRNICGCTINLSTICCYFVFICAKNARDFHVPFLGSMCGRFSAQFESFVKPYPLIRSTDSKDVRFLLCNHFGNAFKNLCNISDHGFITMCHKRHSRPPFLSIA